METVRYAGRATERKKRNKGHGRGAQRVALWMHVSFFGGDKTWLQTL